jgi:hypothetical protein
MIKNAGKMVDVAADVVSEVFSSVMLGFKIAVNAFKQYGCKFDALGNFQGDCPAMENPQVWLVKNGKSIDKDAVKRTIQVMKALE